MGLGALHGPQSRHLVCATGPASGRSWAIAGGQSTVWREHAPEEHAPEGTKPRNTHNTSIRSQRFPPPCNELRSGRGWRASCTLYAWLCACHVPSLQCLAMTALRAQCGAYLTVPDYGSIVLAMAVGPASCGSNWLEPRVLSFREAASHAESTK